MNKQFLSFFDLTILEHGKWLVSSSCFNSLCEVDTVNNKVFPIDFFGGEPMWKIGLHKNVVEWKDQLYFFPCDNNHEYIDIYDKRSQSVRSISFPEHKDTECRRFEYQQIGNAVWIISRGIYFPILKFCLDDNVFEIKQEWNQKIMNCCREKDKPYVLSLTSDGPCLYLPIRGTSTIVEINTESGSLELYDLKWDTIHLELIGKGNEDVYYLTSLSDEGIYKWKRKENTVTYLKKDKPEMNEGERKYSHIFNVKNRVFLIPLHGESVCYVDGCQVIPFGTSLKNLCPDLRNEIKSYKWFGECKLIDDEILVCPGLVNIGLKINTNTLKLEVIQFELTNDFFLNSELSVKLIQDFLERYGFIVEGSERVQLDFFLNTLERVPCWPVNTSQLLKPCGMNIQNYVKNMLINSKGRNE